MGLREILGLAMILYFVIFAIVDGRHTRSAGKPEDEPVTGPPPSNPQTRKAESLARNRIDLMKERGLGRFLLIDYKFNRWLTETDMESPESLRAGLNEMLQEMIRFLDLPPVYTVEVIPDEDKSIAPDRTAECDYANQRINFFPRSCNTPDQLGTLLCHECAHYFCFHNRMCEFKNDMLNEWYTDTVACLMGFSKYMLIPGSMNYLNPDQIRAVRWTLLQERKSLSAGGTDVSARMAAAKASPRPAA